MSWPGSGAKTSIWTRGEIRIKETLSQPDKGALRTDTPKSQAGKRIVSFPAEIAPEIRWHLERFAEPGERGFVFVGPKGGQLRRSNFHESVWIKAREKVGLPDLHFHDLHHTGGTLTAATGATLKELMARLGHSSVRAAMIYMPPATATRPSRRPSGRSRATCGTPQRSSRIPENARRRKLESNARVARVWHTAARSPLSKPHSNTEKCRWPAAEP